MKMIRSVIDIISKFNVILSQAQKRWGIVVLIMSLVGAGVETLGVSVILPLVQVMLDPAQLLEIEIIYNICAALECTSENGILLLVALGVVVVYIIKNVFLSFLSWIRVKYSTKVQRELSIRMLQAYMRRGYSFFRMNNSSELLRGVSTSVTGVYNVLLQFMKVIAELFTIFCILAYIVISDWQMAIGMIVIIGVCLIAIVSVFKGIMKKAGSRYYQYAALSNKWLLQLFAGIKEVLVFNKKEYFIDNYKRAYVNQQRSQIRQTVATEIPAYIIEGTCIVGIIGAVCLRVLNMENTAAYIPQLASFAVAAFRLLPSVGRITSNLNICIFSIPSVKEVYHNILQAEKNDAEIDEKYYENSNERITFSDDLLIEDICWKYPDGDKNVLDHISLSIKSGESVAFVGPSGAGKSTLADIILGLFIPQNGRICLDGHNIHGRNNEISKIISFVPQSVYLLDDTIRRNIAFGVYDEEIDDNQIWLVLEQAQMKEFVEALPNGLDTVIGERGMRFSGGQAQRLAIARALYTNPQILIMDEATSALDNDTENALMEAIDSLQGKVTMIIIAHRLTTVKKCDKIYEVNQGKAILKKYEEL